MEKRVGYSTKRNELAPVGKSISKPKPNGFKRAASERGRWFGQIVEFV